VAAELHGDGESKRPMRERIHGYERAGEMITRLGPDVLARA
jgi:hypothetical protein